VDADALEQLVEVLASDVKHLANISERSV